MIEDWLQEDCPGALSVLLLNYESAILAKEHITPELVNANEDWIIACLQDRRFSLHGRFLLDMLVSKRPDAPLESKWKYVNLLDPKRQGHFFAGVFKLRTPEIDGRQKWRACLDRPFGNERDKSASGNAWSLHGPERENQSRT